MKRLFALLTAILVFITASAQEECPIILDQSSARKMVNSGVDNANIDPIRKDSSRNACARIKIRFANMSRAEVDALRIQFRSNTDIARQEVGYYDNILILEVTAKPVTRFYVQSDTYGQSNEVSLNLEGDCEYEMEARLNSRFSIVVESNVAGADVLIDGVKKAVTDRQCKATIDDVMVGSHSLKLSYKKVTAEQTIDVKKGSISFRQDLDVKLERYDVTFKITPEKAVIDIDGLEQRVENGAISLRLSKGRHTYSVSAEQYHTYSGEIVVGGRVERQVALKPNFGWLNVDGKEYEGAAIYVDDMSVGRVPISKYQLASGEYKLCIVKELYKPYEGLVTINDDQTTPVSVKLEENFGWLEVSGANLEGASVALNGRILGKVPFKSDKIESGEYNIKIYKNLYKTFEGDVVINALETTTLHPTLEIDFATVSISTDKDAEIWVNNSKKGVGRWSGDLKSGFYQFEARREGYYTQTISADIAPSSSTLRYNIDAPTPILGSIKLKGLPKNAKVEIDNKKVDLTDNQLINNVPIGNRQLSVSKFKYSTLSQCVRVNEGEVTSVNASLKREKWVSPWKSFNLSVFADVSTDFYDVEYGFGINWRLFKYNSWVPIMIGARYAFDHYDHYVTFPISLNLNWMALKENSRFSIYSGVGAELLLYLDYTPEEGNKEFNLFVNWIGIGFRHHDFHIYSRAFVDDYISSIGCRYSFYF